jgi:rubrerythrin
LFKSNEVIDIAIRIEKNGEAIYRQAITQVANGALKEALQWMADEEAKHMEWFTDLKSTVQTSHGVVADELSSDMLASLIGDQSFSLKNVDFSQIRDVGKLVNIFIEFENDSILFYKMLIPFITHQETLDHLQQIIAEEERHVAELESFADTAAAVR